jgi:6-pyruvoyl-tetrahydropterin synthase
MRPGITEYIDCAHFLPGHPKCGQIHGHTYGWTSRSRASRAPTAW